MTRSPLSPILLVAGILFVVGCANNASSGDADGGRSGGASSSGASTASSCEGDACQDNANCGGFSCRPDQVCVQAQCVDRCSNGEVWCNNTCVDPATDEEHCGASGNCQGANAGQACDDGEACQAGSCVLACPGNLVACEGRCVDPATDEHHCGATADCQGENAGEQCPSGYVCNGNGMCELTCTAGFVTCGSQCVDPTTNDNHCGASGDCLGTRAGTACGPDQRCVQGACESLCPEGLVRCGESCVDPLTNTDHCGAWGACGNGSGSAGVACPEGVPCSGGLCVACGCPDGQVMCGGRCISPSSDEEHCGARDDCTGVNAGMVCLAGQQCINGQCTLSCPPTQLACDGRCISPATDNNHCGAREDCLGFNRGVTCPPGYVCNGAGECELRCQQGLVVCDGVCTDPRTSNEHCGASLDCVWPRNGEYCPSGFVCSQGQCVEDCEQGLVRCNGACINPLTDNTYCGARLDCEGINDGQTCPPGYICNGQGSCMLDCGDAQITCGGRCADPLTDNQFCGASGACTGDEGGEACGVDHLCNNGVCELHCELPRIACNGGCVDPLSDERYCGATSDCTGENGGEVCTEDHECVDGGCVLVCEVNEVGCNDQCVDPLTNEQHCGAQLDCTGENGGEACPPTQVCQQGTCADCTGGLVPCGGNCVDPQDDEQFCGASLDCVGNNAGVACTGQQVCVDGACVLDCGAGLVPCGDQCIDPLADEEHCGASSNCLGGNAGVVCTVTTNTCSNGVCTCNGADACTGALLCGSTGCACPDGQRLCGADACIPVSNCCVDADCEDGNACTHGEACVEGGCVPGVAYPGSTSSHFDAALHQCVVEMFSCGTAYQAGTGSGCGYSACETEASCEDGICFQCQQNTCLECCANENCDAPPGECFVDVGVCEEGSCSYAPDPGSACTPDADACTVDACDANGACAHTPYACNDNNACTVDACVGDGTCSFTAYSCDDGNACTTNACNGDGTCSFNAYACDDGNACTTNACNGDGSCTFTAYSCDDGNPCTVDSCNGDGTCAHTAYSCDDGNACTVNVCNGDGTCSYNAYACNDGNACTVNVCNGDGTCSYNAYACDDGNACTVNVCNGDGTCSFNAYACNDGNPCTADSCNGTGGCNYNAAPLNGAACNDGNGCSTGDHCWNGSCVPEDACNAGVCPAQCGGCGCG
ncbi:MAG: hypothetical protein AB2A00_25240 [Myxococcota bacterium]